MEGNALIFVLGTAVGLLVSLALYLVAVRPANRRLGDRRYRDRADQLVALTSHYLLTPISIIQNAVARLQEEENVLSPDDKHHLYEAIYQGQQRLWILAERFVIAGEIQDDEGLKLVMKVADLSKVLGDSIAAVDSFAREKQISIHYTEQVNVVTWETHFDMRRLKQAFIAVLDNAVKFSQDGGAIRVSLDFQADTYQIIISDNGIGMPKDLAQHLGEPLSRGTSMYSFDYEGIGLGLYVAKEVIRALGGSLTVESQLKLGTVVTIEFPRQ